MAQTPHSMLTHWRAPSTRLAQPSLIASWQTWTSTKLEETVVTSLPTPSRPTSTQPTEEKKVRASELPLNHTPINHTILLNANKDIPVVHSWWLALNEETRVFGGVVLRCETCNFTRNYHICVKCLNHKFSGIFAHNSVKKTASYHFLLHSHQIYMTTVSLNDVLKTILKEA